MTFRSPWPGGRRNPSGGTHRRARRREGHSRVHARSRDRFLERGRSLARSRCPGDLSRRSAFGKAEAGKRVMEKSRPPPPPAVVNRELRNVASCSHFGGRRSDSGGTSAEDCSGAAVRVAQTKRGLGLYRREKLRASVSHQPKRELVRVEEEPWRRTAGILRRAQEPLASTTGSSAWWGSR